MKRRIRAARSRGFWEFGIVGGQLQNLREAANNHGKQISYPLARNSGLSDSACIRLCETRVIHDKQIWYSSARNGGLQFSIHIADLVSPIDRLQCIVHGAQLNR
jgi:hypothetical protein